MRNLVLLVSVAAAIAATGPAQALQYITGHVTQLEPSYMPNKITLQMDAGNAACPAGKWLVWTTGVNASPNTQDVYGTMLAALLSSKPVDFVINDNDASCNGQFFHIKAR